MVEGALGGGGQSASSSGVKVAGVVPQKGEREGERSQLKRKRGTREDYTTIALAKRENGTRTKWDKELQRYQKSGDEKKQVCSCARKTRESRLGGTEKTKNKRKNGEAECAE